MPEILEKDRTKPLPLTMNDDITITARFMPEIHSADTNVSPFSEPYIIEMSEMLRVAQFYSIGSYHCEENPEVQTEDHYEPGTNTEYQDCIPHSSDYNPQDWRIDLSELLRIIQFYNFYIEDIRKSYHFCPELSPPTEDLYCPGGAI